MKTPSLILALLFCAPDIAAQTTPMPGTMVLADTVKSAILRKADSARYYGLSAGHYNFPRKTGRPLTADKAVQTEKQFNNALVNFATDLYRGADINRYIRGDEVSGAFKKKTDSFIVAWILALDSAADINKHFAALEPEDADYRILKEELKQQIGSVNNKKIAELTTSINLYRWIKHIHSEKYIVVNIPSATLGLYDHDSLKQTMKVVVGKPSTRTPRFSTWCNKVVLYPYWNVPANIAAKELLPKFKRSPASVDAMDMQILNRNGKIVDPYSLNWASFNRGYFPYTVRQCTGCNNALGVIKFNLTDPFSVYMHDTNNKPAFLSNHRYLSHGCIRVSQPIDVGNYLLDDKLDSNFLKACYKSQAPVEQSMKKPVPVFVVYMTAAADSGRVMYYKDIYRLNK